MPLPMPVKAEKGCTTDREGMVIKTEAADEQPDDCLQPCSSSSKSTRPIKMVNYKKKMWKTNKYHKNM
jgi:hypothetical protein